LWDVRIAECSLFNVPSLPEGDYTIVVTIRYDQFNNMAMLIASETLVSNPLPFQVTSFGTLQSVRVFPSTVIGGDVSGGHTTGTVTMLSHNVLGSAEVSLATDTVWQRRFSGLPKPDKIILAGGNSVLIRAPSSFASFDIFAHEVLFPHLVNVTATYNGVSKMTSLTILPPTIPKFGLEADLRVNQIIEYFRTYAGGDHCKAEGMANAVRTYTGPDGYDGPPEVGQDIYIAAAEHYLFAFCATFTSPVFGTLFVGVSIPAYEILKVIPAINLYPYQPTSPSTFLSVWWSVRGIEDALSALRGSQSISQLQSIEVTMASPVDILVQDFLGRRIGFDPSTGTTVNDLGPLAFYSGPGTEPQTIYIGVALPGLHIVTGVGTGNGAYTLTVIRRDANNIALETKISTGMASTNQAITPLSTVVGGRLPGDINGDEVVNQADLIILSLDLGKTVEQSACGFLCDLDFDGLITSSDAQKLQSIYNRLPIANAGVDQSVNEGDLVTLNGSASSDPQNLPLTFSWSQIAGSLITLNLSDPVHPTFTAPSVPFSGATLSFQLTVSDSQFSSTPATVNITVKNVNHSPLASVGLVQTVAEASLVTLDGSASYDPDSDPVTFLWTQIDGPDVVLLNPTTAKPTFLTPIVGPAGTALSFQLTVTDSVGASATATMNVNVTNVNHPPIANAGADQTRNGGTSVQLDASGSTDPDSDPLTFTWSQTGGPSVTLSPDVHNVKPTFVGPQVSISTLLTFQLFVDDNFGGTASSDVHITLLPVDAPPVCTKAVASPALLWAPDHKLQKVTITRLTDPDDKNINVTVTQVTQDEPVGCTSHRGDWNYNEDDDESRACRHTKPDAIIHPTGQVMLRAERRGHGNGRVYQITFQADDGRGGSCTGQVVVCVPHDRHRPTCVEDGQRYDSTQP
jgi:hypothetical protein